MEINKNRLLASWRSKDTTQAYLSTTLTKLFANIDILSKSFPGLKSIMQLSQILLNRFWKILLIKDQTLTALQKIKFNFY